MLVLGIEPESSERATRAPNLRTPLSSPTCIVFNIKREEESAAEPHQQVWVLGGGAPLRATYTHTFPPLLFTREPQKRECKTRQERKKTAPPAQTQTLRILRVREATVRKD